MKQVFHDLLQPAITIILGLASLFFVCLQIIYKNLRERIIVLEEKFEAQKEKCNKNINELRIESEIKKSNIDLALDKIKNLKRDLEKFYEARYRRDK